MTYRLADTSTRSWTPGKMAKELADTETKDEYWNVLGVNHKAPTEDMEVYIPPDWEGFEGMRESWTGEEDIPLHYIHAPPGANETPGGYDKDGVDVFIAGSGPVGATYARKLVDAGLSVVMCEMGATDTMPPASHKKNEIEYQKDIDRFVNVIKGALSPVSIPQNKRFVDTLDPASWNTGRPFVTNGKNPRQEEHKNLSAQAVTRGTGGMATHWTCAVPHFLPGVERPVIDQSDPDKDEAEWKELYDGAGELIYRSETEFDEISIRHTLVLNTLKEEKFKKTPKPVKGNIFGNSSIQSPLEPPEKPEDGDKPKRVFKPLPLAARRNKNSPRYVDWKSAASVYGDLIRQQHVFPNERKKIDLPADLKLPAYQKRFRLLTNHRVTRYAFEKGDEDGVKGKVVAVEVQDLKADSDSKRLPKAPINFYIKAKYFVTAAGAVATPQILFNSGLNNFGEEKKLGGGIGMLVPNLGRYITEQPMAFCQVVLKKELVDLVQYDPWDLPWWKEAYNEHNKENEQMRSLRKNKDEDFSDPLPFPRSDPEPQITSPVTVERPWHTQIHRDAFSYGAVAATIDSRLVVDFRWFGRTQPEEHNRIKFEHDLVDAYGMPQPTFEFTPNTKSVRESHAMMADMCEVAQKVGGYLPASEPQFMAPGLALHLGGTTRLGHKEGDAVANFRGQVYGFPNLFVAGNGVIDTAFAANPTLTSMALAIYSAEHIAEKAKEEHGRGDGKIERVVKREVAPWLPNPQENQSDQETDV